MINKYRPKAVDESTVLAHKSLGIWSYSYDIADQKAIFFSNEVRVV